MTGLMESIEKAVVKLYRKRISRRLYENSSKSVEYGPFKGMKLVPFSNISSSPLALKVFGLYECEVVDFLTALKGRDTLINIGAGDGYYSVGLIQSGTVSRALSFELEEKGREAIAENARRNGMTDRIRIFGAADAGFHAVLAKENVDPSKTIVLCDIEGAEFSVISDELVAGLAGAVFAIEIHPFMVADGIRKLAELEARLSRTNHVETAVAKPRNWSGIPELEALHDNARALVASDGRKGLGTWLFATPRS